MATMAPLPIANGCTPLQHAVVGRSVAFNHCLEILFVSANFPNPQVNRFFTLLDFTNKARAVQFQLYEYRVAVLGSRAGSASLHRFAIGKQLGACLAERDTKLFVTKGFDEDRDVARRRDRRI